MGDDTSIVQSFIYHMEKEQKVSTDKGLIKYLMRHWHSTPFEMREIKYHIKLQYLLQDNGLDIGQKQMNILQDIQFWIRILFAVTRKFSCSIN